MQSIPGISVVIDKGKQMPDGRSVQMTVTVIGMSTVPGIWKCLPAAGAEPMFFAASRMSSVTAEEAKEE